MSFKFLGAGLNLDFTGNPNSDGTSPLLPGWRREVTRDSQPQLTWWLLCMAGCWGVQHVLRGLCHKDVAKQQQGSYMHLRVAQARSYLPLKMQPSEGLLVLLLALSWRVFPLTSCDAASSETFTPSCSLSSGDHLGSLSHAVTCSRFLLYSLTTRSGWKWDMQSFVPIKPLWKFSRNIESSPKKALKYLWQGEWAGPSLSGVKTGSVSWRLTSH